MDKKENKIETEETKAVMKPKCGIIMPISPIDGCGSEHWLEILSILKEVCIEAGFEPNLVSDADEIGIIQKRIIQNVYSNEIVICDVSGKNPNVMFELGMRLAFDKATVIIKDDKTDYSFDTGVIEHLSYPRDLRFHKILEFKTNLKKKVESTFQKSISDPNYSTFLKNFGEYKIAHLQEKEVTSENFILNSLEEIRHELKGIRVQRQSVNSRRQFEIDMTTDNSLNKARKNLISNHYDKFISELKPGKLISLEEFYNYLEKQEDVRDLCGNSNTIRRVMENVLSL